MGAVLQAHTLFRHAERAGEELDEPRVRFAIHRWCLDAHAQLVPERLAEGVLAGAWLDAQREPQCVPVPAIPAQKGLPVNARSGGSSSISSSTSPTMATIGDRSMPLMGGSSRCAGTRIGSVRRLSRSTAGL